PLMDRVRHEPSYELRVLAAQALGQLGQDAREALPALTAAAMDRTNLERTKDVDSRHRSVCEAAIDAVRKIDPAAHRKLAEAMLPILREILNSTGPKDQAADRKEAAVRALALLGPHATAALGDLRKAVLRRDIDTRAFVEACVRNEA